MSPEQARGRPVKATADVYSVGVMLYELLAGRPPFTGDNHVELAMKHVSEPPQPLPAGVPRSVAAVIARALEKAPEDRYASAALMAAALRFAVADPEATMAMADTGRTADLGSAPTDRVPLTPPLRTRRQPPPPAESPARAVVVTGATTTASYGRRRRAVVAAAGLIVAAVVGLVIARPWESDSGRPLAATDAAVTGEATASSEGSTTDASVVPTAPPVRMSTVPTLRGLTEGGARARARKHHLRLDPSRHASRRVAEGRVISQDPESGTRVRRASTVRLRISTGPPPVQVPDVAGADVSSAQQQVRAAGLTSTTVSKSSTRPAGTVLSQSAGAGDRVPPGTAVQLTVAASKSWKPVEHFTAQGETSSDIFRIRGGRWRVTYTLTFGKCDFSCYPPSIYIHNKSGTDFKSFELTEGTHSTSVPMSPGRYYVEVSTVSQDPFDLDIKVEEYA
jgi:serine/threonine-protein kinase